MLNECWRSVKYSAWSLGVSMANRVRGVHAMQPLVDVAHKAALAIFPPPRSESVAALPHAISLVIPARHPSVYTLQSGQYDPETTALLQRLLRPGMVVVDVGANIGYVTTLASRLVESGRVFAFEADAESYAYLERNIRANDCRNVTTIPMAVADVTGALSFLPDVGGFGRLGEGGLQVQATTLDDYFQAIGAIDIGLIKVDVEGGELAVLRGMRQTVASCPNLKLVIEYNPHALRVVNITPAAFFGELSNLGLVAGSVIGGPEFRICDGKIPRALERQTSMCNLVLART